MTEMTSMRITVREFMELPETNQIVELLDGKVIVSPTPIDAHQGAIVSFMRYLFRVVETGIWRVAPMSVILDEENAPEPDIFWVSGPESLCKLGPDGYWYGAPDLIIEVQSPSTARRDRGKKFDLYERHGVHEYWMVDAVAQFIEVYRLIDGRLVRQGVYGVDETFISSVLGELTIDMRASFGA